MTYLWENPSWPDLTWDTQALATELATVRHKQGRLLGRMESLGFELRSEANLRALADEVVTSCAIEGERLDAREVRSSIARRLGLDVVGLPVPSRAVEGVVEMMLDATNECGRPLTAERLFAWHAALFPTGRSGMVPITVGAWRGAGPMQVVSGPPGRERIHFEAPDASRVAAEMERFLRWFNDAGDLDPVLQSAVAHLWFVTIHPFDDGNGRIARAIVDLLLARSDQCASRFYSFSSGIEAERDAYYVQLESAQRGSLDITTWIAWTLGCLDRVLDAAGATLAEVRRKADLWRRINERPVNERQRLVLARMLGDWQGHMTSSKYARLAKCSTDSALRDLRELVERGLLVRNEGGGRSTSYRLADLPAGDESFAPPL